MIPVVSADWPSAMRQVGDLRYVSVFTLAGTWFADLPPLNQTGGSGGFTSVVGPAD